MKSFRMEGWGRKSFTYYADFLLNILNQDFAFLKSPAAFPVGARDFSDWCEGRECKNGQESFRKGKKKAVGQGKKRQKRVVVGRRWGSQEMLRTLRCKGRRVAPAGVQCINPGILPPRGSVPWRGSRGLPGQKSA